MSLLKNPEKGLSATSILPVAGCGMATRPNFLTSASSHFLILHRHSSCSNTDSSFVIRVSLCSRDHGYHIISTLCSTTIFSLVTIKHPVTHLVNQMVALLMATSRVLKMRFINGIDSPPGSFHTPATTKYCFNHQRYTQCILQTRCPPHVKPKRSDRPPPPRLVVFK